MADEKTITQADVDKAIKDALATAKAEWEADKETEVAGLKKKNQELLNKVRAAGDITPEEVARIEAERDKALGEATDLKKQVGTLTKERDTAAKALEAETTAARTYALDAEINAAIAAGNVVPALVPAFTALLKTQAKADLVDGKYAVTIGDKPAAEHIKGFLESEDGKAYRAAPINGGGGAPGGKGGGDGSTNPFAKDSLNLTEQARLYREDPTKAAQLASAAGVDIAA